MKHVSILSFATDRPQRGRALLLRGLSLVLVVAFCLFDQPRVRAAFDGEPIAMNSIGEQLPRAETVRISVACLSKDGDFDISVDDGACVLPHTISTVDKYEARPATPVRHAGRDFNRPPETLPRAPPAGSET